MMAVRSPLSVFPPRDMSNPYARSSPVSLEAPSGPIDAIISSTSTPNPNSTGVIEMPSAEFTGSKVDESSDDKEAATANAVHEPTVSQSALTIQTTHSPHSGFSARSDEDEPPQSVIHAPPGFGEFTTVQNAVDQACDSDEGDEGDDENEDEDEYKDNNNGNDGKPLVHNSIQTHSLDDSEKTNKVGNGPISPPPLSTAVTPSKDWSDRATPRAQTRHDFEEPDRRARSSSLEDIPEGNGNNKEAEINALRAALAECWTLCNTLASLSYINRERLFQSQEDGMQEDAWRSCWRLCQKLYETRDYEHASEVNTTLDLCRDFCQALFEVRVCESDLADSVLRVSFELNNHLFNTHDRNLPDAFRERTLDFYITLCHRLMKQRTRLTENDSLLSACWSLAEMLFSIRQSKREGRVLDEELLGSAVQACWELCDIFRRSWTLNSMRNSDRGTPRPSQTTFAQAFQRATRQTELDYADDGSGLTGNPETPTTIFEDTATVSPDEAPVPNILVLGHGTGHASQSKWPSSASSISEESRSSEHTASSANTVTTISEDPNFTRLRILITKAAINSGYQRGVQNLSSFVKSLPSDAFGSAPWQTSLLKNYRKLVAFDPAFRNAGSQARAGAIDVARACQAMLRSGQYSWLRDLYRLVFGFHLEEAMSRKGVIIQT